MANYPGAIDSAASLYSPVDAFSGKPLETTTASPVLAGDSTINVGSSSGGFAASYGILSIDDELIVYSGKSGGAFTGCQRGAFGTTAASHNVGATVKANMVAGFITALQSAVLAIENDLGTAAARNYVRKDGAVTCTGLKTFQDGAEFGSGTKSSTGLVRLPNNGAIKWRKQDNSGDLGVALNASNHLVMDAIIDFAAGQTFGAFSYPDASTAAKGIVQIDATGGLAVATGVVSLADTAVAPGTYTKLTVDQKGRATAGALLSAADLPAHTHTASDIVSGSLPFTIQNNGTPVGTRRALNLSQGANIGLTFLDVPASDCVNVTVALSSVPAHNHAASDINSGTLALARGGTAADLSTTGPGFLKQASGGAVVTVAALAAGDIPNLDTGKLTTGTLPLVRGGTGANLSATGPGFLKQASGGTAVSVAALVAGDLPSHTHTSAQISDATAAATASTIALRDSDGGAWFAYAAANNLWAYLDSHLNSIECGPFGSAGGPYENMAKYSEDFSVATWDKNTGSCSVTSNSTAAPDSNMTADTVTASTATPIIQQQIAGLVDGGTYTFYVWAKVGSGTKKVSLAIVNNAYGAYLVGPTQVTLTTSWQRLKVTGTLAGGQTGLWIVVRQYAGNGDDWTSGGIYLWGACLQQGTDPKKAYARTWAYQTSPVAAGVVCGSLLIVGKDTSESPFKVRGPGSPLADHTLLEVTAGGELILAAGTGNGYRFAEIVGASNPSGWAGSLKVKTPGGATAGYILLYTNP